ncbi:TPA: hypothetical protein U1045_001549 [Streptococcus suis]|nr:hypothetical protein [Streptococcus suis]
MDRTILTSEEKRQVQDFFKIAKDIDSDALESIEEKEKVLELFQSTVPIEVLYKTRISHLEAILLMERKRRITEARFHRYTTWMLIVFFLIITFLLLSR